MACKADGPACARGRVRGLARGHTLGPGHYPIRPGKLTICCLIK